ncbi:MAG: NAD-dependent epimerase/dehydratase family protein [Deltaproteobacteria bacterium]|nr:NAD-dependent epimerase/dehydratase family protein [Deltaproteobacteria bacterium]
MRGKILITGATGFVGRRLLRAISREGYEPTCLVRSQAGFKGLDPGIRYSNVVELSDSTGIGAALLERRS